MTSHEAFEDALKREPQWMQDARRAALRAPPDTRNHDARLRQGQTRGNTTPR